MAEVDTSFYTKAPQGNALGVMNPLDAAGKVVGIAGGIANIQNAQNQNALFQQQFDANKAMGPIMQQSVDPATGQVDYVKATMLMAADPRTAFKAPEFAKEALLRQQTQADVLLKNLDIGIKRSELIAKSANGLMALGPQGITFKHLSDTLMNLVGDGVITPIQAVQWIQNAPPTADRKPGAGDELYKFLQSHSTQGQNAADGMKNLRGDLLQLDQGGQVTVGRFGGLEGPKIEASVEKTPTTEQRNNLTETFIPGIGYRPTARQDIAPMYSGTGRQVNERSGMPQMGNPDMPGQVGSRIDGPITKLPPARQAYEEARGKDTADYQQNLDNQALNSRGLLKRIEQMEKDATQFQPGGGSEFRKTLAEFLQAVPVTAKYEKDKQDIIDSVAKGNLGAMQAFDKLGVTGAMESLKASAGVQNRIAVQEFLTFLKSNPNIGTDPRAIQEIFNFMRRSAEVGLREQQEFTQWKGAGKPPEDFAAAFSKKLIDEGYIDTKERKGVIQGSNVVDPKAAAKPDEARAKRLKELLGGK